MTYWEYCEVEQGAARGKLSYYGYESTSQGTGSLESTRDMIARLGEEGWEMVSVTVVEGTLHYFFKRPLEES